MATPATIQSFRIAAQSYLNDTRFSDFTIVCQGKEFKVHRCFICAHTKYFEKCCEGGFAEAQLRTVELKGDVLEAVEQMIHYFYTFDYDNTPKEGSTASSSIEIDTWVYYIANKY